jgi:cyclic pyranopterin phosphate synthase
MINGQYELVYGRVQTRSLEVHIVDHCNLRCWGCCSLSPYLPKWCIAPADLERDLLLARRVLAPYYFKLVGGEPLLHPAIDECLDVARRAGIAPVVSVTTNGFLLPHASERFWQLIQALTVSIYPHPSLPVDTIALIKERALEHGVSVNWKQQDQFADMDLDGRREDAKITQEIYDACWLRRRCHIVSKSRFFTCTRPPHFESFYGSEPRFLDDGIELEEAPDMAERLLAYLQRPEPLQACSFCKGGNAPNRPHRQMSPAEINSTMTLRRQ